MPSSPAPSTNDLQDVPLSSLLACHECDLLLRHVDLPLEHKACCPRCGYELQTHRAHMSRRALALVLTALLLYIPANFLPIMQLDLLGQRSEDTVWSAVLALYQSEMVFIAVLVFLCSMAIPLLKLLCQLWVLLAITLRRGQRPALQVYRLYHHLREWGMLEVYLMGILVAIVKLADLADLHLGVGIACFIALLLAQVWLEVSMSPHQVWDALEDAHARA